MAVKWKTIKNDFPDVERTLKNIDGKSVKVGCLEGDHAWLAAIHEYGCHIKVTPKMRAYLHYKGLHLKSSTTEIVIPERSFLRAGYDDRIKDVLDYADKLVGDLTSGKMSEDKFLKTIGLFLSSEIKEFATDLSSPPNHSFTKEQKGSSNPLWDTGQMIGGITYKVE